MASLIKGWWEVYIWVPTKGWQRVARKMVRDLNDQIAVTTQAIAFHPLETKLSSPTGRTWHGGSYCAVDHKMTEKVPSPQQIERLAGELEMLKASYEPTPLG